MWVVVFPTKIKPGADHLLTSVGLFLLTARQSVAQVSLHHAIARRLLVGSWGGRFNRSADLV